MIEMGALTGTDTNHEHVKSQETVHRKQEGMSLLAVILASDF